MAWSYGFYNSLNGDRVYNADQMSAIFEGLITSGVYESVGNKLAVQPNSGMTIQINTGRGWFGGRWVNNDSEFLHTLEGSDVLLNRYCAVCVRVNNAENVRAAEPYFKYSEFATNPVKPTMERSETVKEYCLAYVYIKAGATSITAADIEDTRGNAELCGWVTGLIDQLDTATLYEQWQAVFFEWFDNLESYLDANVETKLVNDVLQLKGKLLKNTVVLSASGWSDDGNGVYIQSVDVNGVTSENDILVSPTDDHKDAYILMDCDVISKDYHSITFECTNPNEHDIILEVFIFNVDLLPDVTIEDIGGFVVSDDGNGAVTIS